jgi:alkylation response protein AidB-like acyl-CoA dehydrogenase
MLLPDQKPTEYEPDKWTSAFFQHRSSTIWGGTAQVQRNIVGERVLGLPKEPSPGA